MDHHGLGLFRRFDEGLAAPLYLDYDRWSSSSKKTTRHRFTENEIPDCWISGFDWLLYWLLTRSVSFYWLSLRESRVWFGCLRLSLHIPFSHDSRTLRRCIHPHHNILTFAITTYARRSPMKKSFWIRSNQQTNWLIVLLSHYQHLLLKHGFINWDWLMDLPRNQIERECWNLNLWGTAMLPEAAAYWWQLEAHGSMWIVVSSGNQIPWRSTFFKALFFILYY